MSWKDVLKGFSWEKASREKPKKHEESLKRLKDIIDSNAEFELKGNKVIIKPSWLDNTKSWAENVGYYKDEKFWESEGIGKFYHKKYGRTATQVHENQETLIPKNRIYVDYFYFYLPTIDHNDYDSMIYVYAQLHYNFKGKEYNDYVDFHVEYRDLREIDKTIPLSGTNEAREKPIPDYYASFLSAIKDKNKFMILKGLQ